MTMTIRPDPARPAGGQAILSYAGVTDCPASVTVAVLETFGGRWLAPSAADSASHVTVGDANWQAGRHEFGPYETQRNGDSVEIVIGPEIVNKIDGYMLVRIVAGSMDGQCAWPDDIIPLAGASGRVAMQVLRRPGGAAPQEPVLVRAMPAVSEPPPPPAAQAPAVPEDPATPETVQTPPPPQPRRNDPAPRGRLGLYVAAGPVLLAAGVAAWFLSRPAEVPPNPVAAVPAPTPEAAAPVAPAVADNRCTVETLGALGDFAVLREAVAACGDSVSADTLLSLVESAAARGDGAALLMFGALYDDDQTDALAETRLGLTFGDVPPQAAEYYHRAVAAGAPEARARLDAVCARLAAASDTLSIGARDDFCR